MAWLELTVDTVSSGMETVAAALSAAGFDDLVLEDQQELEQFLDQNRAYWDYIDESLQQKLQGLSRIKLYLEDSDSASMAQLQALLEVKSGQPDYNQWLQAFCKRKYNSDFSREMSRSVGVYLKDFLHK